MSGAQASANLMFWLASDRLVPESEAVAYFAANAADLSDSATQDGCLVLSNGSATLKIADTLLYMVPGLCFDALAHMQQAGKTAFSLWSEDTLVVMEKTGGEVAVSFDGDPAVHFPSGPFEGELFRAGERFIALAGQLWPGNEDRDAYLAGRMAAARAALNL